MFLVLFLRQLYITNYFRCFVKLFLIDKSITEMPQESGMLFALSLKSYFYMTIEYLLKTSNIATII